MLTSALAGVRANEQGETVDSHTDAVRTFHLKHAVPMGAKLENKSCEVRRQLFDAARVVNTLAKSFELMLANSEWAADLRTLRIHLILDEVAELAQALGECDRVEVLDALADLEYVTKGCALTFDLPLEKAFDEVHRSNMTKKRRDPKKDPRIRDKGEHYSPPDLATVLSEHDRRRARLRNAVKADRKDNHELGTVSNPIVGRGLTYAL